MNMKDEIQAAIASAVMVAILAGIAWVMTKLMPVDWLTCVVFIGFFTLFGQDLKRKDK